MASQPRQARPIKTMVARATCGDELVHALYGLTPEEIKIV
jgi:hypothetical protein